MSETLDSKQLQAELIRALADDKIDFGRILALSTALARHDPEYVRFSVDAALIGRLGEELVARQETAVSEIVKNAFDADATIVTLTFSRADEPAGRLLVEDNGNGMTREQLIDGFMRLASPDKTLEPKSPLYHRTRAGKKGIGRFAVQRLGTKLTLFTRTAEAKRSFKVDIDWQKFQQQNELGSIASKIGSVSEGKKGTLLIIDNLREAWPEQAITRAYRFIEELLQPFPLAPVAVVESKSDSTIDPGFKVTFRRSDGIHHVDIASEQKTIFEYAVGLVTASVDDNGVGEWKLTSEKTGIPQEVNPVGPNDADPSLRYQHLRNVHLQAHYFIYKNDLIPGSLLPGLQDLGSRKGGIRLYRNGFRVLPYGEPESDWLRLDEDEAKRRVLGPLGNKNWFGFIEIRDEEGKKFEETSSREGLLETPSFAELKDFASSVLKLVTVRIANARGRKGRAGQRGFVSRRHAESPAEALRQAAGTLLQEADRAAEAARAGTGAAIGDTLSLMRGQAEAILEVATVNEQLVQELTMLRILSSLGLTIAEFSHEVKTLISAITSELVLLSERPDITKETLESVSLVNKHFTRLETYVAYFDKTISANVRRQLKEQDLSKVTYEFYRSFKSVAQKNGVILHEPAIQNQPCLTKAMHPSEWASILVNLFTNSIKAIRRAGRIGTGQIEVRVFRSGTMLNVDFLDNGDGIPEKNEERIFEAFFTTSISQGGKGHEHEELLGTGLGLKIVSDIVESNNGDICVVKPVPTGFSTCLRVSVPASEI